VTIPYLYATHILDYINPNKTLVVNAPAGLRTANEKMYTLRFPEFMPETIVSAKKQEIQAFLAEKGKVVLKPLAGKAGEGILVLVEGDRNFNSLVELSTQREQLPVMVQDYLSAASEGDKRIMLLDGEPLGAINRVPAANDYRGNMAVGGSVVKTEITSAERDMCQKMTPTLRQDGLYFVGIDIIGGCLTEVNVTSPTGLREIQRLENSDPAHRTIEWTVQTVQSQCDRSEAAQIG
jgi:glutathione synthase